MDKREKLEALKAMLANTFGYEENVKACGTVIDVVVKKVNIAIHVSDEHDQEFYLKVRKEYRPFFIREEESMDFITEKMQNCVIEIFNRWKKHENQARHLENMNKKMMAAAAKREAEKPKRKRQRIVRYEKV